MFSTTRMNVIEMRLSAKIKAYGLAFRKREMSF